MLNIFFVDKVSYEKAPPTWWPKGIPFAAIQKNLKINQLRGAATAGLHHFRPKEMKRTNQVRNCESIFYHQNSVRSVKESSAVSAYS